MSDEHKWHNLQSKLEQTIGSLMFSADPNNAAVMIGLLDGVLRLESGLPDAAIPGAQKIRKMYTAPEDFKTVAAMALGKRRAWIEQFDDSQKASFASALVAFFRFVCKRGEQHGE